MNKLYKYFLPVLMYLLFSCNSKTQQSDAGKQVSKQQTIITLQPGQVKAISLQLGELSKRNLKTALKVNGKLTLPPQNKAQVSLLVGGIVKSILVEEGQLVGKGQTLAIISNNELLQLQQNYLENKAKLGFLSKEFERQKELQKENINSGKTFQQAEADYLTTQAKDKSMEEQLALYGIDATKFSAADIKSSFAITAPIGGHIHSINVSIGKYAEPNRELFDIVDNRYLHIDLTIYEQDIHKLKVGQRLTFSDANDPTHVHTATIFGINKAFEDNQQAVIAHAKIEDATETLLPGMFVEARILIDSYEALTLPDEAIVSSGDDHFIFAEQKENVFEEIPVRTGTSDMGFTEVMPLKQIESGRRIVVSGAYYLLSELTKGEGESE